jgi:hypothetical protein
MQPNAKRTAAVEDESSSGTPAGEAAEENPARQDEPIVKLTKPPVQQTVPLSQASRELYRIRGTWPFDFYPDTLIIEELRIVVHLNYFPFQTVIHTIPIHDIFTVTLSSSWPFASLGFMLGMAGGTTFQLNYLKRREARRAKEIMDGLMIARKESIEIISPNAATIGQAAETIGGIKK